MDGGGTDLSLLSLGRVLIWV